MAVSIRRERHHRQQRAFEIPEGSLHLSLSMVIMGSIPGTEKIEHTSFFGNEYLNIP